MKSWIGTMLAAGAVFALTGCMSADEHAADVQRNGVDQLTVGTVQREIHVGMSGAEVAAVLGSPNVVTTDEERREVWIYDKIATDEARSTSSGGVWMLILGVNRSASASSTSQRTLTVIVKYDHEGRVRDFAYHTSRF